MTIDVVKSVIASNSGVNNGTAIVYVNKFGQTQELAPKINVSPNLVSIESVYTDRFVVPSGAPHY